VSSIYPYSSLFVAHIFQIKRAAFLERTQRKKKKGEEEEEEKRKSGNTTQDKKEKESSHRSTFYSF
jgi:hypothetical protein